MYKNKLLRKRLVVGIILLFVLVSVFPSTAFDTVKIFISHNRGNILYVGGNEPGNYSSIQAAINDANSGDTVFVYDDSSPYYENVVVNKSINLIGEDNETTVIDAQKDGTPVRIVADGCLVSGFTILNCEDQISQIWGDAVIKIDGGNDVIIKDNILNADDVQAEGYDRYGAIELNGCTYCSIINNYIVQNKFDERSVGIVLHENSSNNIISGNDISNYHRGVMTWDENDRDNTISENYIHHNEFGIAMYGGYNEILNNTIEYNTEVGINIQSAYHNTISGNIIQYNGGGEKFNCGIELMGYTSNNNNYVSDNVISNNNPCGLQTEYSDGNVITRNNFIDNYGEGGTPERWWGNAYFHIQDGFFNKDSFEKNYWSDYSLGIFPKIIHGILEIMRTTITINWINFDWNPAKEPYDIQ